MTDICITCDVPLISGENWYPSFVTKNHRKCKTCYDERRLINKIKREGMEKRFVAQLLKLQTASQFNKVKGGHIYIISNPAWDSWYKVGSSIDAKNRRNSYHTASPFRDYKLNYKVWFDDRRAVECKIHIDLESKGVPRKGEWFQTNDINKIKEVIHEYR